MASKFVAKSLVMVKLFEDIQTPITRSGDYNFSVPMDGLQRKYLVHVPPSYHPANPTPMVMAFHGGGGDMNYMARDEYYGLISKSNKEGFIIVFPNGYSKFENGIFATWNAGIVVVMQGIRKLMMLLS